MRWHRARGSSEHRTAVVHPSPLDFPPAGRSRLLSGPELFLSWTRPAVTSAGIAGHAAHKTMQLQVQVDQAQALRRGINAPFSTVKIEVDPAQLSPEVREEIASNLLEGCRLNANITVVEPSLAGLISVIDRRLKVLAEKKAKAEELRRKTQDHPRKPRPITGRGSGLSGVRQTHSGALGGGRPRASRDHAGGRICAAPDGKAAPKAEGPEHLAAAMDRRRDAR